MKISTKGRYALRVMVYLAENYSDKYISIKSISESENISQKYLEQIVSKLSKNNLLESARGAYGGYRLIKSPEECSVGDILRTMEGNFLVVDCVEQNNDNCINQNECPSRDAWSLIQLAINKVVDNLYLSDLLAMKKARTLNNGPISLENIFNKILKEKCK